ncbi:hypothetical protein GOP47_0018594 [Adiantum capillus-veneris]|uniref:protein-serine/threonine phosphatase n=1 Tax=Adiantum capillus-veneris TaxID=13818 RepID=A0A9D4UDV4_ADICA|nr:hypothetical protein GOP47_0018594 [Adiantum capillus-veneris]
MNTGAPRVPTANSTRGSEPSISGENEAVGDRSSRAILEDAILAGASDALLPLPQSNDVQEGVQVAVGNGTGPPAPPTGIRTICGRRKEMEDAVCVVHSFLSLPLPSPATDLHYFAVYDGHGGAQAALHCRAHMHLALAEEVLRGATAALVLDRERWESCMKVTFLRMDREVGSRNTSTGAEQPSVIASTSSDTVGSTAIVAVLSGHHIIVANCGDSRAVLCRRGQAIALSEDHKPDREDEIARIEAAGGRVFNWNGWRVLGVLAMSRAIGDHFLKPYVIADPDVTMTARSDDDECLILASDGLWDVVSNQDACTIARRCLAANREAQTAASLLVQRAHDRGSGDNISVVVIDLRPNAGMPPP